jgi:hypothetical protein
LTRRCRRSSREVAVADMTRGSVIEAVNPDARCSGPVPPRGLEAVGFR